MGSDDYRRDSGDNISTRLTYLLIGGGIGAVIALLFAPKSGHELRGDIADATRKGIDSHVKLHNNSAIGRASITKPVANALLKCTHKQVRKLPVFTRRRRKESAK